MAYPRFSVAERRKLTLSRRATESFRTIGIRGGADPAQGIPTSTPPYYTVSEDDRAVFEATMNMTHDNDIKKARTAKGALAQAFKDNPIASAAVSALYNTNIGPVPIGQVGEIAWMALRFAGYLTETEWEIPDSEGYCSDGEFQAIGISNVDVQGGTYNVSGGQARQWKQGAGQETVTATPDAPDSGTIQYTVDMAGRGCRPVICKNGSVIDEMAPCSEGATTTNLCPEQFVGLVTGGRYVACDDAAFWFQYLYDNIGHVGMFSHLGARTDESCGANWSLSGTAAGYSEGDEVTVGFRDPDGSVRCDVLGNGDYDPTPALADMAPVAATDLPITDIPLNDLCDIIDALKNDPALQDILPDTLPDPVAPPPIIDPNTGLPPGTLPEQPPDPGANPLPGEPPVGVPVQGECFIDATTISTAAVDALKSGQSGAWAARTNDNAERLYAPQGTDGCRDFDPIDEAYLVDALVAEGWSNNAGHVCPPADWCDSPAPGDAPPGVPVAPVAPPGAIPPVTDPIDSGIQDPEDGACMTLAGKPAGFTDAKQPGGISRKFQPGQPITIDYGSGSSCRTKITRVKTEKGSEGGPEVCASPTIDNGGKLNDKECYGPGPVVDEINTLLGDMVAEGGNIIFDSECTRELHRPMCFRAGTSKRVILNKLLDMCGFCVFPMFDCNVIVGYCGPVNVHWTYHEDVDLMAFDLEYDGQEVFDYVQVFRGDKMDQAGRILEVGGDVFYPVGSPASSVSGDRVYQHEVPYGTPQADMLGIAMTLAAKLRTQAMPLVAYAVPLNSQLQARHQLHFKRPSLGFDAVYMVTKPARDYDRENGHLSTGLARWLRGS